MLSLPPPNNDPGTIDPKKSPTLPMALVISFVTESIAATASTLEVSFGGWVVVEDFLSPEQEARNIRKKAIATRRPLLRESLETAQRYVAHVNCRKSTPIEPAYGQPPQAES